MSKSVHTYGFEVVRFIHAGLDEMDDEDRLSVFEGLRMLFCMFCGKRHPKGGQCLCWDKVLPCDPPPEWLDEDQAGLY